LKTTSEPLCPSHWDDSLKRLALGSWVTVNSTKSTSGNDSVPDGSIWGSFKDDVISLEKNEDMSSSSSSSTSSKKPPAGKALKIRLYPNSEEKQKLLKWIGTARWTYNQSLAAINSDIKNKNKKYLRANYITNRSEKFKDPNFKWVLDTPCYIRDAAMLDLLKNYKSNVAAKKKNFKLKFRSKKDRLQSIVIPSRDWGRKSGEFSFLMGIKSSEQIPEKMEYDCRLTINRLGEFYLCIPRPLEIKADNQGPKFSVVEEKKGAGIISLDPGVRTFMTDYNPSGEAIEWGKGDINRMYRLCLHYDRIQSERDSIHGKENKRKRYKLRRCMLRIHKKIRNLVDECHRKFARWLCENHHVVLLPEFKTKNMVKRGFRKIHSKTARQMMTWSHYRFRQYLLHKSREYPWCKVVICTEEYTSKTCGCCGVINKNLGSSKTFRCPSCGATIDRDVNGARNVLLKYITENKSQLDQAGVGAYTQDTLL
jgi:putative transposase